MINKLNRRFLKFSFNRYNKSIVPVKELMAVDNKKTASQFKRNIKSNSLLQRYRAISFITGHNKVQRKENRLPDLLNGDKEETLFCS